MVRRVFIAVLGLGFGLGALSNSSTGPVAGGGTAQAAEARVAAPLPQTRLPALGVTKVRLFRFQAGGERMEETPLVGTTFRSVLAYSRQFADPVNRSFVLAARFTVHGRFARSDALPEHDQVSIVVNDKPKGRVTQLPFTQTETVTAQIGTGAMAVKQHHAWRLIPVEFSCEPQKIDLMHRGRILKRVLLIITCTD